MAFETTPLGEVVELKRGYDLPAGKRNHGDVPVVSSRGITGQHDLARANGPGVVTGRTGTLGEVFFVERDFWPLNTTLYVRDFKGNDPRFVAYLLQSLDLRSRDESAAIPGLNRLHLHDLPVPRPPLRKQREIATTLGRLDARASLLRHMEAKLAAMAAALFELVPKGRHRPVGDLCVDIGNGATPPRRDRACWDDGTRPWFKSGELDDGPLTDAGEQITEHALETCRLWPAGTVLVAMYASPTVGRLGVLTQPAAVNQACCALVAKPECGGWTLFHALLATRDRLADLATGAAQQNISQAIVREHEMPVPTSSKAAREFHERVSRLHVLRAAHRREVKLLEQWRNTLLPELLKGTPQV